MSIRIKKDMLLFLMLTIPFAYIVGSRGATPDTQIYYDVFKYIDNFSLLNPVKFYAETGMEIGFGWYSWVLSFFSKSSLVLFFIFSFLNFFFIYKTSKLLNQSYFYTLLFYLPSAYFFMQQFMQMRQGLAISIVIYSVLRVFKKQNDFLAFFLIIISFFLHQTAIVLFVISLVFYTLNNNFLFSSSKIKIKMLFIFIITTLLFKFVILDVLVGFSGRLQSYSGTETYSEEIELLSLPNLRTFLILSLILIFSSKSLIMNIYFKYFLFLMIIALSARIGFSEFAIMSGRLSTAFSYVEIFAIPMILLNKFSFLTAIFFAIIYFFIQIFITLVFQAPYLIEMYRLPLY